MNKISIIVPIYGEDEYLDECISSIVNQTYKDLEIILVDDGSPDRCPEICDSWANTDSRIKVIHKKNGGLVSARKEGMRYATGKYVGYVDGDDWIDKGYFEAQINVAESNDADIVISGYTKDLYGKVIACYQNRLCGLYEREDIVNRIVPNMMCAGNTNSGYVNTYVWNKLFRKDIVSECQFSVDDRVIIGEDSYCVYPAILKSNKIWFSDETGYHYRQRMNSLLRKVCYKKESIDRLKIFYTGLLSEFENSVYSDILCLQLKQFYINQLIMMSDTLVHFYRGLDNAFPFFGIKKHSKVAIYSAGAYGIHVYNQIEASEDYKVSVWVDPDHKEYIGNDSRVNSIDNIFQYEWDYCIIASTDKEYVKTAIKELESKGVMRKRIVTVFDDMRYIEKELMRVGVL